MLEEEMYFIYYVKLMVFFTFKFVFSRDFEHFVTVDSNKMGLVYIIFWNLFR